MKDYEIFLNKLKDELNNYNSKNYALKIKSIDINKLLSSLYEEEVT